MDASFFPHPDSRLISDRTAEAVVDLALGFPSRQAEAVAFLSSLPPESGHLILEHTAWITRLAAEIEDPISHFERLTGHALHTTDRSGG